MNTTEHLLLIDKPKGITSFDVIRRLRTQRGIRKMGHAGTLDPLASGLMIIGVGEGTKKLSGLIKLDKEYVADVLVGERRSTGDMEGEVLEEKPVSLLDNDDVCEVLESLRGTLYLPVSAYSAIKKDGVPMYVRARKAEKKGESITDVPMRTMQVHDIELLNNVRAEERVVLTIRFFVGSGTYIRSLAEEIGRRLGYPATIKDLRRTRIDTFCVEDAEKLPT
jgi:tRNA pseudouridine55 synthase